MPKVCDDCLTVAYDNGVYDYDGQVMTMLQIGDELDDHICNHVEEPEIQCACACH